MESKNTTTTMLELQKAGRALRQVAKPVPVPRPAAHVAERMREILTWLGHQEIALTDGLRSISDAEKLYDYWKTAPGLTVFADSHTGMDTATPHQHHINAIGYSPLV